MYWQVYLHKTSLVAEKILVKILQRAKDLVAKGKKVKASKTLTYFLKTPVTKTEFNTKILEQFSYLDDFDVIMAVKDWQNHNDVVLSTLSKMLIQRKLPKVILRNKIFTNKEIKKYQDKVKTDLKLQKEEINYFVFTESVSNHAYSKEKEPIYILQKNGNIRDLVEASDHFNLEALTKPVIKHFIAFPKIV